MGPTHRLAIDLGTCHTVAVVRRGDEAPRALLFDGSPVMASGIYADETGRLSVGRDAERLSQLAPSRFEPYPKRSVDQGSVLLGDSEVTVVEMLAALLKRVADESLQAGVNPVGSTVLTCPADWGGQRRGVLLEAARAANLGPVLLVDEPIAAATYCLRVLGQQVAPLQSLAVFDFGGGTLDVSVVRREAPGAGGEAGLRVLSVGGLDDLGGVDVDAALVGHLGQLINLRNPEIWQRLAHPDSTAAHRDRRALWNEVRAAKEMLSRASSAPIHVPGTEEALHITREELERVAGPLIDRAVDETRRVLERAGVDVRQLAGIFLVGGSSRIPLVASRLHARFGVAPVVPEQPELPVAYGGMLAVATPPQQLFDGSQVAPPRPVSGTPAQGHAGGFPPSTAFPVSAGFQVSSAPTSPGAYGSPAGLSQPFGTQPATAPASPAGSPGFTSGQGGPAAFGGAPPSGVRPGQQGPPFGAPGAGGQGGQGFGAPGGPGFGGPGGTGRPGGLLNQGGPAAFGAGGSAFPPGGQGGFNQPPVAVRPRRRTAPWIALVVVLALIGGCFWGGAKVFGWVGDQFESAKSNFPGSAPTGENGNLTDPKVEGLKAGKTITVDPDAGSFDAVAGAGAVYTAESTATGTKVSAYATLGDSTWAVSVPMAPEEVHLSLVGDLLLVDGERDGTRDGKGARSVIDKSGKVKWTETYDNRLDLFYVRNGDGVDAVVEDRSSPSAVRRVDLLTGKDRWAHPGPDSFFINGQRTAKPALTWTKSADAGNFPVPSYDVTFSNPIPFQESIGVDPSTVVQFTDDRTANLINVADGKTKATAQIKNERNGFFMAYGGTLVLRSPGSDNALVGYSMRDLSKLWDFKAPPGTDIEDMRPCAEKLVCLVVNKSLTYTTTAINVTDGKQAWSKARAQGDEPNWFVVDGKLLMGKGSGSSVDGPSVVDPANGEPKYGVADSATAPSALAAGGGWVAVRTLRNSTSGSVWQVSVANIGTGKVVGTADVSASSNVLTTVSVSADSLTAIDKEGMLIYRYSVPKG